MVVMVTHSNNKKMEEHGRGPKAIKVHSQSSPVRVKFDQKRVLSPVKSPLPPITNGAEKGTYGASTNHLFLEQGKEQVSELMKHLITETHTVEAQIQAGLETLWQRMQEIIDCRRLEMEQEMESLRNELTETQDKLNRVNIQEATLVQQNAKTSTQLTKEEKKRKELEQCVSELKTRLDKSQEELNTLSDRFKEREKTQKDEVERLQLQLEEKTKTLKDYQLKISKLTEKMNGLSKDFSQEKTSSEKLQKNNSEQLAQLTSENKKLILEISKLKGSLTTMTESLKSLKEEKKKLEQDLNLTQKDHELTIGRLNKKHNATVKELEEQIALLKTELAELKQTYKVDTDILKRELMDAQKELACMRAAITSVNEEDERDDFLEARIHFLRHQNKQEKVKMKHEISTKAV